MANGLIVVSRNGAVGFIVWLDGCALIRDKTIATRKFLLPATNQLAARELPLLAFGSFSGDAINIVPNMLG